MEKIETFTTPETRFLSNFYPYKKDGSLYEIPSQVGSFKCSNKIKIFFEGLVFGCTENAYQAAKTLNPDLRKQFVTMTPYEAKAYWRGKENEVRSDWEDIKYEVLKELNRQKFLNHPPLLHMLAQTGDAILEEGNTWGDTYWGICNGVGENNLGKILMEIRDTLPFRVVHCRPDGTLEISNRRITGEQPIGFFPFKNHPNLLVHIADKKTSLRDSVIYLLNFRAEYSVYGNVLFNWTRVTWPQVWELCCLQNDIRNMQILMQNKQLFQGPTREEDVQNEFLTRSITKDRTREALEKSMFQVVLIANYQ